MSRKVHSLFFFEKQLLPLSNFIFLSLGEMISRVTGGIYVSKWKDKRDVLFLSTKHQPNFAISNEKPGKKLRAVNNVQANSAVVTDSRKRAAIQAKKELIAKLNAYKKQFATKKRQSVLKPTAVIAYNNAKTYIDVSDQIKSYADCTRRGVKWYRKLMIELFCNVAVVNAFIVYLSTGNKKIKITEFREKLTEGLLLFRISLNVLQL